jgi:hypothetical protein
MLSRRSSIACLEQTKAVERDFLHIIARTQTTSAQGRDEALHAANICKKIKNGSLSHRNQVLILHDLNKFANQASIRVQNLESAFAALIDVLEASRLHLLDDAPVQGKGKRSERSSKPDHRKELAADLEQIMQVYKSKFMSDPNQWLLISSLFIVL